METSINPEPLCNVTSKKMFPSCILKGPGDVAENHTLTGELLCPSNVHNEQQVTNKTTQKPRHNSLDNTSFTLDQKAFQQRQERKASLEHQDLTNNLTIMLMKDTSKKKAKKVFARNANARNSNLFNRPSLETMELHSRLDVQYLVLGWTMEFD